MSNEEGNPTTIDADPNTTVRNWCNTRLKVEKLSYTWEIHNVSFHREKNDHLKSSEFAINEDDPHQWYLSLCFEKSSNHVSLYLYLNLLPAKKCGTLLVKCKCSVLNAKKEPIRIVIREIMKFFQESQKPTRNAGYILYIKGDDLFKENSEYLCDDKLTIWCEISYTDANSNAVNISSNNQRLNDDNEQFEDDISRDISQMYLNPHTSDVTLSICGEEYAAHKFILAARSPVFRAMFKHEMKEEILNRVEIDDIDVPVFQQLLQNIYSGKLPAKIDDLAEGLLGAADKYDVIKLKLACEQKLRRNLSVENAMRTLNLAYLHRAETLKNDTMNFIAANSTEVMKTDAWKQITNVDLIKEVCDILALHLTRLISVLETVTRT